jgi:predicted phage terminase large subunit-like protein
MISSIPSWVLQFAAMIRGQLGVLLTRRLRRSRNDPNEFVAFCFTDPAGEPLCQATVHRDLQAFLSANRKALVELPRDHGKSTQVCARVIWELGRDPSLRIKIVCASEALAAERARFIREAIAKNPKLRLVFPKLNAAHPWSDTRLTVERPANVIGPSLTAIGIGAASTGARADLLICDDIVDVKALASRAERDRVKNHFRENLMNLLEPDGRFWGLCTPWHRDDLNAELKRNQAFPLFRRAIGEDLEPVWPERWPREALAARREEIGTISFARGYRLIPITDDATSIPVKWLQYWETEVKAERTILAVDPAISTNARADRSAFVVLVRFGNEIRCLDARAYRMQTPALIDQIRAMDSLWNPDVILFESNAAFKGIADLMVRQESFGAKVKAVTQTIDKGARVAAFSVPVENGKFLLKGSKVKVDSSQQELMDEITTFPQGDHDDLLDAAAMGTAYLLGTKEPRVI